MKKLKFFALFVPLTIGMLSLAACSSDNDDSNNNDNDTHEGSVTSFDQVKFLQNNIVEVDSMGNFVQRVNGAMLNSADSTELSVKALDIAAATKMFKSWLSPDTKVEAIAPSEVDLKADLKDEDGNVKETVYFKATEGKGNVAEVTFAKGGVLKHFKKVKFISRWPLTGGYSAYNVGDREQHDTYTDGMREWVCIREAQDGVAGMLVYLSVTADNWPPIKIGNFASPSLAKAAADIIKTDWNTYVAFFKDAGQNLNSDEYYWIDDWKFYLVGSALYAIRLYNGDIDWFDRWMRPHKHYIQIRTFGLTNNN